MTLSLDWISDRDTYDALFTAAGPTPLTQCWAYGAAKHDIEGWRPRRAVVSAGPHPVAVVQVLEKRLAGLARVARINRGPVWLDAGADHQAVIALLRRHWRWWQGAALLMAPELPETDIPLLAAQGLRRRPAPLWGSAWVDLAPAVAALRAGLKGKWRNMLVGAEKAGLVVEFGHDLGWLLERYQDLMAGKSFQGIPPAMVQAMDRAAPGDLMVLTASSGTDAVAGVLLARHGAAATYLIGWNSDEGKRLKASNLLLWHSMLTLKDLGARWFDLGGIDEALTPGIASFKRGLGGIEYRLAGEWLSV